MTDRHDAGFGAVPKECDHPGRNLIAAIGIDHYLHRPRLTNAVRDAEGTVALFKRLGYESIAPLLDEVATGDAIEALVRDDLVLGTNDSLVLFFAGHGATREHRVGDQLIKTGYLIPVDGRRKVGTWIELAPWLRAVALLPARHVLVILDTCYSGIALDPIIKWRDVDTWQQFPLAVLNARRSRRIITSALGDQRVGDGGPVPGHSLFTGCLLDELECRISGGRSVITASELGLCVQRRVEGLSRSQQTPDFGAFSSLDARGEMLIPLCAEIELANTCPQASGGLAVEPGATATARQTAARWADGAGSTAPEPTSNREAPRMPRIPPSRPSPRSRTVMKVAMVPKLSIALGALAGIVLLAYIAWPHVHATGAPPITAKLPISSPTPRTNPRKIVVGVNDFGGAFAAVVANDGMTAGKRSRFAKAGLDVQIALKRNPQERLAAFDAGEVDVVLVTLDYLANLVPLYRDKNVEIKSFLMADWSRGTLGIVAAPGFKSIEDLKDARVATTHNTPSHYMLLALLARSNLKPEQIETVKSNIVFATETRKAGELFKRGEADAVAIWEPYLSQAVASGKGSLLVSTAAASNLVADVLFARADFLKEREDDMTIFARIWLEGVSKLNSEPEAWVPTIADAFHLSPDQTRDLLKKMKPARFVDNREFFGLEKERAEYISLFEDASRIWQNEGVIKTPANAASTRWLTALEALAGEHAGEVLIRDETFPAEDVARRSTGPVVSKTLSIYFARGEYRLDPNAKRLIDGLVNTLVELGNTYVTVEGYTDSTGALESHLPLSQRRAEAVVDYLVKERHLERARFRAIGKGAAEGDNTTEDDREKNRRTDFKLYDNSH